MFPVYIIKDASCFLSIVHMVNLTLQNGIDLRVKMYTYLQNTSVHETFIQDCKKLSRKTIKFSHESSHNTFKRKY